TAARALPSDRCLCYPSEALGAPISLRLLDSIWSASSEDCDGWTSRWSRSSFWLRPEIGTGAIIDPTTGYTRAASEQPDRGESMGRRIGCRVCHGVQNIS